MIDADGSHETGLTSGTYYDTGRTFSPDGRYIAFGGYREGVIVGDLWIMTADGQQLHSILQSPVTEGFPDWQPDDVAEMIRSAEESKPLIPHRLLVRL